MIALILQKPRKRDVPPEPARSSGRFERFLFAVMAIALLLGLAVLILLWTHNPDSLLHSAEVPLVLMSLPTYRETRPDADGTRAYRSTPHWSQTGAIHWGAYFIAREHKLQEGDSWTCSCNCCSDVREMVGLPAVEIARGAV